VTANKLDASVVLALPAALAAQGFKLRPETDADLPFLRRLYISTRWEELAPVIDWTEAQKVAFLESQFALQRQHYRTYYPLTDFAVLEKDAAPAGRLYVNRQATKLHVIDIALLPEWRGHGTGTALMNVVCAEARVTNKKVSLAVEKFNPAQRLYRRLGFREVADEGVYWIMEWDTVPDAAAGDDIS
jgi:ribosomal protein S18 acetylase RimI-like enzyme